MQHITTEPDNKLNLNIWAKGRPLHPLVFFFWRPGTRLQKSVEGLLRSLLLQLLDEIPSLDEDLAAEYLHRPSNAPTWSVK